MNVSKKDFYVYILNCIRDKPLGQFEYMNIPKNIFSPLQRVLKILFTSPSCTVCPISLDPLHVVIYYIKWIFWTYSIIAEADLSGSQSYNLHWTINCYSYHALLKALDVITDYNAQKT